MTDVPIRLPFGFVYQPGTPPAQAVCVGLQAMVMAVFKTSPVTTGPHERVMAMCALIGAELSCIPREDRDQAEAMIHAAIRGAARGAEAQRFTAAEPAGRA